MKILIIGEGAKELAFARNLDRFGGHEVLVIPGNPGSWQFAKDIDVDLSTITNREDILAAVLNWQPDQVLVLDERICRSPIVEALTSRGYDVFAPSTQSADFLYRKEKWVRFFEKHNLPTTKFAVLNTLDAALEHISKDSGPWVFKELNGRNRFAVPYSEEEAAEILQSWFSIPEAAVLVSEFAEGIRFNVPCVVYEGKVTPFGSMIIQRGIYENEDDPQCKGMGAIAPATAVIPQESVDQAINNILVPFFRAMEEEGMPYNGIICAEFVDRDGKVVCVNMKCGLPEVGSVTCLLNLQSDLMEIIERMKADKKVHLNYSDQFSSGIMMAACGYPESSSMGHKIIFDEDIEGTIVPYHTRVDEDGDLVTYGGRCLVAAGSGRTLEEAREEALMTASHVHCDDLFYRTDIGQFKQ